MVESRTVVLVVASGASWEADALGHLHRDPMVMVLKRCVDIDDLLAAATTGQADAAVLGLDSPGLDRAAVEHLRRHGVRPVVVAPREAPGEVAHLRATRIGVESLVSESELAGLSEAVRTVPTDPGPASAAPEVAPAPVPAVGATPARVLVVWGPAGAPGRTTLAMGLAAHLARRQLRTVLVDADPYGGTIAQQWGVLDEVSGLLAAVRLAHAGGLVARLAEVQRAIGECLSVVTGLPRPDRWSEVRSGALAEVLGTFRTSGQVDVVLVDTGFSLEQDPMLDVGTRPGRNQLTIEALQAADQVVVVGAADPVGLARLGRGLVELRSLGLGHPVQVVVNQMRPTLGWSQRDIATVVSGFAPVAGVHFVPEDRAAADRALVAGRTVVEAGDSSLSRAIADVAEVVAGAQAANSR